MKSFCVLKNILDMCFLEGFKIKQTYRTQSQNSIYSLINVSYKILFFLGLNSLVYVKSNSRLYERRQLFYSNNQ